MEPSWRDRRFIALIVGFSVNSIGSWAAAIAIWGFAAYRFHASAYQISILTLCWTVPGAVLLPVVGVWVDRVGPKRSMIIGWLGCAASAFAMAWTNSLIELQGVALIYGAARGIPGPAGGALVPRLVADQDLLRLNALLGVSNPIGQVVGPLVASATLATAGFRAVFTVDAITYLAGVAVIASLILRPADALVAQRWHLDFRHGLQLALNRQLRPVLLLGCAATLTSGAFLVVEPLYAQRVLHRPASQFALFEAAAGVGAIAAGLALGSKRVRVSSTALIPAVAAYGLMAGLFVGTTSVPVAYLGAGLWGVAGAIFSTLAITRAQAVTPQSAHGRVLSLLGTAQTAADITGLVAAGPALTEAGIRPGALGLAAIPVVTALIAASTRP